MKVFVFIWMVLEFIVFFAVAHWLGLLTAILLLLSSMIVGGMLVRSRMQALQELQRQFMMGQPAGLDLIGSMATMMAGFFLLIPGFLSSIIGLLLLVPMWRNKIAGYLLRHGFVKRQAPPRQAANEPEGRVIDGEAWRDKE